MKETPTPNYSNAKLLVSGIISLLGAFTILILFVIFVSISKPSYRDLNKFIFVTLCITFGLFIVYGICCFLKDYNIRDYALKTWACCLVVSITVILLSSISLMKSHDRKLPTSCLGISICVSGIIFLINTEFCIDDMLNQSNEFTPAYMLEETKDVTGYSMRDDRVSEKSAPISYKKPAKASVPKEDSKWDDNEADLGSDSNLGKSLRKEIGAPANSIKDYKSGTATDPVWKKTHFIFAIDAGANMKRKWGQMTTALQDWLKKVDNSQIVFSLFTFDTTAHLGHIYKTASELSNALNEGIEIRGDSAISIEAALKSFTEIIQSPECKKVNANDYLHYGVLVVGDDSKYPRKAMTDFTNFKKKEHAKFFFNAISQVERSYEISDLVKALDGVHYSVRRGYDFGDAVVEALNRAPS